MGRRGPKPAPAAVKLAKGNSGRRPIGVDPELPADIDTKVAPPDWLKGDALDIWLRLAPRVIAMKLLGPLDVNAFARYCRNFARWLKMQKALDETETYTVETASGVVHRARPEFLIADRLERQLVPAEDRFGLNPAERQRIFAARATGTPAALDLFGEPVQQQPQSRAAPRRTPAAPAKEKPSAGGGSAIGFLN